MERKRSPRLLAGSQDINSVEVAMAFTRKNWAPKMAVLIKSCEKLLLLNLVLILATAPFVYASDKPEFARSLNGKFIVGYQGWFGCPGDDGVNQNWIHTNRQGSDR